MLDITRIKKLSELDLPPAIYRGEPIATAVSGTEGAFTVFAGMQRKYVDDLKTYSLDKTDTALQENTSDYKRFGIGAYAQWYAKTRYPFALIHDNSDTLASIIWFGPSSSPRVKEGYDGGVSADVWDTGAFRTYGAFRGAGITTAYSFFIMDVYRELFPKRRMWLGVQKNNTIGMRVYSKLGFETIGEDVAEGEFIIVLKK